MPRIPRLLAASLLLGACGPAPGSWPGEGEVAERTLTLAGGAGAPARAKVLLLGFTPDQVEQGRPDKTARPAYYWTTDELAVSFPLEVTAPLPPKLNLLVVLDADDDGRPDPEELSSGLLADFVVDGAAPIDLSERFADLAKPTRGAVDGTLELSVTLPDVTGSAVVVVLGYDDRGLREGLPRGGALPGHLWKSDPQPLAATMTLDASLPRAGLTLFVALDTDGDGFLTPGEPLSAGTPAGSSAQRVVIDRRFQPPDETPTPPPTPTPPGDGPADEPGGGPPAAATPSPTDPSEFVPARLTLTSESEARAVTSRFLVVGYPGADPAEQPPGTVPTYRWTRLEKPGPWPVTLEGRVPKNTPWYVVLDADESGGPSAGDLASGPQAMGAGEASERTVALDRVLERRPEAP